jgi:hypothetical protein
MALELLSPVALRAAPSYSGSLSQTFDTNLASNPKYLSTNGHNLKARETDFNRNRLKGHD